MPFRALPGDHDHQGTLGPEAVNFLTSVERAGFSIVHDLPITPPDQYDSPYSSTSTFAVDPQRIDLYQLADTGDLSRAELDRYQWLVQTGDAGPDIKEEKRELLKEAFLSFMANGSAKRKDEFARWSAGQSEWLYSYAAFEILQCLPENKGKRWQEWTTGRDSSPEIIEQVERAYPEDFFATCYTQWVASEQTARYLDEARRLGIEVWGDVPFYVGDCEVWSNRNLFNLDENGYQLDQGGAAPSMTSATGQLWGFATYKSGGEDDPVQTAKLVDWWTKRLSHAHALNNGKVRLDHFIGFAEPYIIPAGAEHGLDGHRGAGIGKWVLESLVRKYGEDLPFYPEDLGTQTDKTPALRDAYGLATNTLGVRSFTKHLILGEYDSSIHNPDNYRANSVNISSNHDSPPLVGAIEDVRSKYPGEFDDYFAYLKDRHPHVAVDQNSSSEEIAQVEMERLLHSIGKYAIVGVWDVLKLGTEGQYNVPATVQESNWSWRMNASSLARFNEQTLYWRALNEASGRSSQAYTQEVTTAAD